MSKEFKNYYVIDTNIILTDANNIFEISQDGENLIILPETTIDEIDSKKSGFGEINFQAREFGRILSEGEFQKTERVSDSTITNVKIGKVQISIISLDSYNIKDTEKSIINDRKIIEVAKFASEYFENPEDTYLLSNDVMCRIRATSYGIKAQSLSKNKDEADVEFIRVIENFNSKLFEKMDNAPIDSFVKDHTKDNFCYHFKCVDGNEKLAYIVNDRINFITDELFRGLSVKPLNVGQKFAMAGMIDDRTDICVMEALAGSGKTLLAVAAGIKKVKEKQFDKIVYIRNSVESVDKEEEVGFLSGNDSKFIIYNYPLLDTLGFIAKKDKSLNRADTEELENVDEVERIQLLQAKYKIETMWPGSIRGRTLSNAFVIIDEIQNFSKKSAQTVISRLDKDCKVVCIGSNRQIDNHYINKYTNGLNKILKATKKESDVVMFGTELNKVVRGRITSWAEKAFED